MNFIRIVLIATSHPGNIGSAARAMKTMGINRLYLVQPKAFPHKQAMDLAAGAHDILDNAIVCNSLTEAIGDCSLVFATSARSREFSLPVITPAKIGELTLKQNAEVAFVFGRESSGLTNDELLKCNYQIQIPTHPNYSSLNLAQAVQIICYELWSQRTVTGCRGQAAASREGVEDRAEGKEATIAELEQFYQHLQQVLQEINFLKPENPKKLMYRLRRLYNRAKLDSIEVNILRGMLTEMQNALNQRDEKINV